MKVSCYANDKNIDGKVKYLDLLEMVKSCGKEKDLVKVATIHADVKHRISKDIYVSNC